MKFIHTILFAFFALAVSADMSEDLKHRLTSRLQARLNADAENTFLESAEEGGDCNDDWKKMSKKKRKKEDWTRKLRRKAEEGVCKLKLKKALEEAKKLAEKAAKAAAEAAEKAAKVAAEKATIAAKKVAFEATKAGKAAAAWTEGAAKTAADSEFGRWVGGTANQVAKSEVGQWVQERSAELAESELGRAVGKFVVDASGKVVSTVEDWADEAVDAATKALEKLIEAGTCLKLGPVECVLNLRSAKMIRMQKVLQDYHEKLFRDHFEVIGKAAEISASVLGDIKCTKTAQVSYPVVYYDESDPFGEFPKIRMKEFPACSGIGFNNAASHKAAFEELKEQVLSSTLVAELLELNSLQIPGASLLERKHGVKAELKTGHELVGTSCDTYGAFEIGLAAEAGSQVAEFGDWEVGPGFGGTVGLALLIGCKENRDGKGGTVEADVRFNAAAGIMGTSSALNQGSEAYDWVSGSVAWNLGFPDAVDDGLVFGFGHPALQGGVSCTGPRNWLDFSNPDKEFSMEAVIVDFSGPKFVQLMQYLSDRIAPVVTRVIDGLRAAAEVIGQFFSSLVSLASSAGLAQLRSGEEVRSRKIPGSGISVGWELSTRMFSFTANDADAYEWGN